MYTSSFLGGQRFRNRKVCLCIYTEEGKEGVSRVEVNIITPDAENSIGRSQSTTRRRGYTTRTQIAVTTKTDMGVRTTQIHEGVCVCEGNQRM